MSKLIYCAVPSRLSDKKEEIMDFVTNKGYGPLHPFQAYPFKRFEGGPIGREKTMEFCKRLISISDEFWLFGISNGTVDDLKGAIDLNKPITFFLEFDPEREKYYEKLSNEDRKFLDKFLKR